MQKFVEKRGGGLHHISIRVSDLEEEIERLHQAIAEVLEAAIGNRGATISDYSDAHGQPGRHQYEFYVAHRGGQACRICQTTIQRIKIRNRGTYFCPNCQKK